MSGRKSRNKGASAEREVAAIIKQATGRAMHRTPLSGGMQWKGDIQGWPGTHWECKRAEKLQIPAWLRQTEADCPTNAIPLLVFRQSREPWRVVIQLDDLLTLMKEADK